MPPRPVPFRAAVRRAPWAARAVLIATVGLVVLAVLAPTTSAQTADPGWTQLQGGPEHRGWAAEGPEAPFAEAWALEEAIGGPVGSSGLSAVAVADGIAVTVAPDAVIAVDATTGTERWRIDRAPGPPVPPAIVGEGADASAVFVEGFGPNPPTAATGATPTPTPADDPDASGEVDLVAVAVADGQERWRADLPSPSRSGVAASDDAVYVGGNDGSVTAVDAATGQLRWTQPVGGSVLGPPSVAGDLVVVSAAGDAETAFVTAALEPVDGSVAWRYEPAAATNLGGGTATADGLAYVALDDRTVRAVDLGDGAERWVARLNWIVSPLSAPAVAADHVVVVDLAGQVYAIDRRTGERLWDHALNVGVVRSAPVVSGTNVLIASASGELLALDLGTGDLVFRSDVADGVLRTLAVAGDRVIGVRAGSRPGLVAFETDPGGELVRIGSPTIADAGTLATNAAIALIPLVVVLLGLGRLLAARMGPAKFTQSAPHDPIEDGDEPGDGS